MLRSMTAFGRAQISTPLGDFTCELKCVNHRYLDAAFRLPDRLRDVEAPLRDSIRTRLNRGRVDVSLRWLEKSATGPLQLDMDLIERLLGTARQLDAANPGLTALSIHEILRWPGVIVEPQLDLAQLAAAAQSVMALALDDVDASRIREGAALANALISRLDQLGALLKDLGELIKRAPDATRARWQQRLADLGSDVEPARLAQELAIVLQRGDVAEEMDRLQTHMSEFRRTIADDAPVGRRLDFLAQELQREANTLSAKAATTAIAQRAVDVKVLIEQLREQVQNVE